MGNGTNTLLDFGMLLPSGGSIGVWGVKDFLKFFEGTSLGLNEDKVDKDRRECVPADEPDVVLDSR